MRWAMTCIALLGFHAAMAATCVTYNPDPAAFPLSLTVHLVQQTTFTKPDGSVSFLHDAYQDSQAHLTFHPTDVANGFFGRDNVPPFNQKCDGVFGSAHATTSQNVPGNFVQASEFTAVNGVITVHRDETAFGCNLLGSSGCTSYQYRVDRSDVLDLSTGLYRNSASVEERWTGTTSDGGTYLSIATGSGSARGDVPMLGGAELAPVFPMTVNATSDAQTTSATASFRPRPQEVNTQQNVYVFAMAPRGIVKEAVEDVRVKWRASGVVKDEPAQCVLAQMNAAGQLQGAAAASLQPALSTVLGAQGQAVTLLSNAATSNVAGATFYLGYGQTSSAMINGGVNRSAFFVPGAVTCQPQSPQTGWWWNPLEDGRGFSIEVRGNNAFFAAFLYDVSGKSTWYVASGPVSLDGSLFVADLLAARNGQTLGGAYAGFPVISSVGALTLAFTDSAHGVMTWPGGTVPLERFNIVPNGLTLPAAPNQPQSGWWWNPEESGRGFFMEWQNGWLDVAGYMYDERGDPVWYISVDRMKGDGGRNFGNTWWSFSNGQTLTGAWKPNARVNPDIAPLTITFSAPDTAVMTLPNGRTTSLTRQRF
jgi:hypothetical protein